MTHSPSTSRRIETTRAGSHGLTRLLWQMVRPALPIVLLVLVGGVLVAQDGNAPPDTTSTTAPTDDSLGMPTDPVSIMKKLGWMGWLFLLPFVGATLIALWYTVERMVVLKRSRVIPKPFVDRFLEHIRQQMAVGDDLPALVENKHA